MNPHDLAADLAARFRLDKRPRSWTGDCPACGYARAFSLRIGKGARPSLYCANGCTRDALDEAARNALGNAWRPPERPSNGDDEQAREAKQAKALATWAGSVGCAGTAAALYLAGRGIGHAATSAALRFRADCGHPERRRYPAMVALVQGVSGQPIGAHRTYLSADGRKADADPVKASLGPVWGGAVRIDPAAPALVIGEGIETAASAGLLLRRPAWAAISAGNLGAGLVLPPEVRDVVIAADPDPAGQVAAAAASVRWRAEGRRVCVATPDRPRQDFNDLLLSRVQHPAGVAHG